MFGGNLTRLTAGFKSQSEIEMEKEKKKQEYENRPVPLEWQVEKYERTINKQQEEYVKRLEAYCEGQKAQAQTRLPLRFNEPPPPPPCSTITKPNPPSTSSNASTSSDGLPQLIGNSFQRF